MNVSVPWDPWESDSHTKVTVSAKAGDAKLKAKGKAQRAMLDANRFRRPSELYDTLTSRAARNATLGEKWTGRQTPPKLVRLPRDRHGGR